MLCKNQGWNKNKVAIDLNHDSRQFVFILWYKLGHDFLPFLKGQTIFKLIDIGTFELFSYIISDTWSYCLVTCKDRDYVEPACEQR